MNVTVMNMTGFEEAINSMYLSKRTWTPELSKDIHDTCANALFHNGAVRTVCLDDLSRNNSIESFNKLLGTVLKIGQKHTTLLRFIDLSIMTEEIHRAGQDDIDSHAKRFENRIIRSSTRLSAFYKGERSYFYKTSILPTDEALDYLGIKIPEKIEVNGESYIRGVNGYIKEDLADNQDVVRGLYMLSIPTNFISKISLCEWCHVYKMRNKDSTANPEVKEWAESVMDQITKMQPKITREYVLSVDN